MTIKTGFQIGDIVRLKSGSCDMTVVDLLPDGQVTVSWRDWRGDVQEFAAPEPVWEVIAR